MVRDAATGRTIDVYTAHLLDVRDSVVASVLSDGAGHYAVRAPAAGTYRVRVVRIGYRAAVSEPFTLAAGERAERSFGVAAVPTALAAVRVNARQRCATRPGEGDVAGLLWSEVLKAAEATQLTAASRPLRFTVRESYRELDGDGATTLADSSATRRGIASFAYFSLAPERLESGGYVQVRGDSAAFYAPDAAVLLSDVFSATHCFRVVDPTVGRVDGDSVGLAFEPVRRGGPPGIRGTLWIDRRTSYLRSLDFAYTGLPVSAEADGFGGRVVFQAVPGGAWIIRAWRVHAPRIRPLVRASVSGGSFGGFSAPHVTNRVDSVLVGVHEAAGEVTRATNADGAVLWALADDRPGGAGANGAVLDRPAVAAVSAVPDTAACAARREAREREIRAEYAIPPNAWRPVGRDSLATGRAVQAAAVVLEAVADTLGHVDEQTVRVLRDGPAPALAAAREALRTGEFTAEPRAEGCALRRLVVLPFRVRAER